MPISNQTKIKIKIQTMRDNGMKWTRISRKTLVSVHRLQMIMEGLAVPTPREEEDLLLLEVGDG